MRTPANQAKKTEAEKPDEHATRTEEPTDAAATTEAELEPADAPAPVIVEIRQFIITNDEALAHWRETDPEGRRVPAGKVVYRTTEVQPDALGAGEPEEEAGTPEGEPTDPAQPEGSADPAGQGQGEASPPNTPH